MRKEGRAAILQAAAKTLAWELFAVAWYGRTYARIDLERFDRELRSAIRHWSVIHKNLNQRAVTMNTTETTRPFWRQGDIYFVKLDQGPDLDDAKTVKTGVIAHGEQTGHMHRVSNASLATGALLTTLGPSMYLRSPESGTTIVHDEHGALELPVGFYAVVNQQELDGLRWRTVID